MGILKGFNKLFAPAPQARLSLILSKNELQLGDEINGSLNISSQEEVDVDEIYVSLRCIETVTKVKRYQESDDGQLVWKEKEYDDSKILFSAGSKIMTQVHLPIGYQSKFPFSLKIPAVGRETYHSVDSNLRWLINAFMNSKNRKTLRAHGNGEILVAKPIVSVIPPKEVVREVVLIPCAYCSGLMPQTSIFCPNCGARRKS